MRLRNIPGSQEAISESALAINHPETQKGHWANVFGNTNPIYIEVGMGKGRFLMDMAEKYPDCNFIGVEMYSSVLIRALQKAEARIFGLEEKEIRNLGVPDPKKQNGELRLHVTEEQVRGLNFRFIRMDARNLPDVFARGEVRKLFLNFSDPWPKERHAHRRLTAEPFLSLYEEILPADGVLEFKTDNQDLFAFSLEEIQRKGWRLLASTQDLHHDAVMNRGNVMTEYEEKFSSRGNPICKLIAGVPEEKH